VAGAHDAEELVAADRARITVDLQRQPLVADAAGSIDRQDQCKIDVGRRGLLLRE
jgi:hypothetical protein